MDDKYNPQDKSSTEKAEGSRENVNVEMPDVDSASLNDDRETDNPVEKMEKGAGQVSKPEKPLPSTGGGGAGGAQANRGPAQDSAGITNRPLEQEQQGQERPPPRGKAKGKSSAS